MRGQMESIVLIGFMGSGKTTVGISLSYKLQCTLNDTDKMIEKQEGRSISEIFAAKGEPYFRKEETRLLEKLKEKKMNTNTIMEEQAKEMPSAFITQTVIRKWGNSQGIRLSKEILSQMNLKEDDTIGISIYNGKMTIEKVNKPKYLNLTERLEAFYKKPIDEIYVESIQEVEVSDPVGNEIW